MKKIAVFVGRVVAAAAALFVLQALLGPLLAPPVEMPAAGFASLAAMWLGTAAILMVMAIRSTWTGWRLAVALGAVYYGVSSLTSFIEAAVFDILPLAHVWRLALMTAVTAALLAPVVVLLAGRFGKTPGPSPRLGASPASSATPASTAHSVWSLAALFAGCSALYLALYFAAGTIIFPFVQPFYEGIGLPPLEVIVPLQLFVRGPLHVAICVLVVAMTGGTRAQRALLAGVVMAGLGGAIPLLVPNPYFPDAVRWVHFAEVVTSNFVFGTITGWVFASRWRGPSAESVDARPAGSPPKRTRFLKLLPRRS
ncbi:MAG TPA: hypothetical protein VNB06_14565 [Thermoanaerobaculia bacterium]|nr:hypothetical protein [Thermoanaerobaculia bacterium]